MLQLLDRFKSDESLMLAYQRGDAGAFESLYQRHKDPLFGFLYRSCPRAAIVEELAQETWKAVIKAAQRYQADAPDHLVLQLAHRREYGRVRSEFFSGCLAPGRTSRGMRGFYSPRAGLSAG